VGIHWEYSYKRLGLAELLGRHVTCTPGTIAVPEMEIVAPFVQRTLAWGYVRLSLCRAARPRYTGFPIISSRCLFLRSNRIYPEARRVGDVGA
jgi:hypothetical protein